MHPFRSYTLNFVRITFYCFYHYCFSYAVLYFFLNLINLVWQTFYKIHSVHSSCILIWSSFTVNFPNIESNKNEKEVAFFRWLMTMLFYSHLRVFKFTMRMSFKHINSRFVCVQNFVLPNNFESIPISKNFICVRNWFLLSTQY